MTALPEDHICNLFGKFARWKNDKTHARSAGDSYTPAVT